MNRKWEMSKQEKEFEKIMNENNIEIINVKEYKTKTKYTLRKNKTEIQTDLPLTNNIDIKGYAKLVMNNLNMSETIESKNSKDSWVYELLEKGEVSLKIKL